MISRLVRLTPNANGLIQQAEVCNGRSCSTIVHIYCHILPDMTASFNEGCTRSLLISFLISFILCTCSAASYDWGKQYGTTELYDIQMNDSNFPIIDRAATLAGLSPYGYRGDVRRVHRALRRDLDQNQSLSIVLLGASVTTGYMLNNWQRDRYSVVLKGYLEDIFGVNVTVHNLAMRATSSNTQAQFLFHKKMKTLSSASLVLVDISVNDRPCHKEVKNVAKETSKYLTSSSSAEDLQHQVKTQEKVFAEGRHLMKLLLFYLPESVGIAYFETFVSGGR